MPGFDDASRHWTTQRSHTRKDWRLEAGGWSFLIQGAKAANCKSTADLLRTLFYCKKRIKTTSEDSGPGILSSSRGTYVCT